MKADPANHWCWICTRKIDINLPWNHAGEWTLDHVVALTEGGAPLDPANLRPAHRVCNLQRQPSVQRPPAVQLALFDAHGRHPVWRRTCDSCGVRLRAQQVCRLCNPVVRPTPLRAADGQRAAELRAAGMKWKDVAAATGFSSIGQCYLAAEKYGSAGAVSQWRRDRYRESEVA
jgi:hypothetical protein